MPSDRSLAEEQRGGDGLVGLAGGAPAQHLQLAGRQPLRPLSRCDLRSRLDSSNVGRGGPPLEYAPGRAPLLPGAIIVAESAPGPPAIGRRSSRDIVVLYV